MKRQLVIYLLSLTILYSNNSKSETLDLSGSTITYCSPSNLDKKTYVGLLNLITEKLDECNANNLDCSHYLWPQSITDENGNAVKSKTVEVNLWERQRNFSNVVYCIDNPNGGITEFIN